MPKHDPPSDDAALLNYTLLDRRDELMARNTPATGLAGLAVQAGAYSHRNELWAKRHF
jgi:hypothetical protein